MQKYGILLINLGTPDNCDPKSVYRYLKQFLNDPRVVRLPKLIRFILVNGFIIPFRYKKSAHAYQQIWTKKGSPLLVHSIALRDQLQQKMGENFQIELGMRYGNPSISQALNQLKSCKKIAILPLFPQYASAATGSAIQTCLTLLAQQNTLPDISIKKDFYAHPHFIQAYAENIRRHLLNQPSDFVIFSYHGLPERHIVQSHCSATCDKKMVCPGMHDKNTYCYRAQCYETSRLIAQQLNYHPDQYQVAFQSRLGRTPWIKPYTDFILSDLIKKNIKNIAVVCPSFVIDCLETLEEINIRLRAQWKNLGGERFTFIPCLNSDPIWVDGLAQMAQGLF